MSALIETVCSGRWLTRERIRLWALAVLFASAAGTLYLLITSNGLNDVFNRPLGTDFSNIYAAGTYVLGGHAAAPYDWPMQHAREQALFGESTPFYGWHYPPFFLFIAGLLARMPYALSLAVWQGTTLLLYLCTIFAILRAHSVSVCRDPMWLLLALAFPAVFINIGHGHNGFLTAALLGGGLITLDRRPIAAGILFGLIAYKPQFGMLVPLVLIATGRWRVFFAAALTVAALGLVAHLAFGPDVWRAFFESMHLTRTVVLEQGGTGWHKIQSVFSLVRMWGGGIPLAYAAQGIVTIALAGALIWLWRSPAAYPIKAAALAISSILATPYSLDYDFVALAPAIAFLAADGLSRGFRPGEKTALALLWFMPLIARTVAEYTLIPLGVPAMLLVLGLALHRAADEASLLARWHSTAEPIK